MSGSSRKFAGRDARRVLKRDGDGERWGLFPREDPRQVRGGDSDAFGQFLLGHVVLSQIDPHAAFKWLLLPRHSRILGTAEEARQAFSSAHPKFFTDTPESQVKPATGVAVLLEKLRALRDDRGAPAALARTAKVASSTVTEWMDGDYHPGLDKLDGIAEYFGVTVPELFVRESSEAKTPQPKGLGRDQDGPGASADSADAAASRLLTERLAHDEALAGELQAAIHALSDIALRLGPKDGHARPAKPGGARHRRKAG